MTLNDLFIKYGSDKSSEGHNYAPVYEAQFKLNPPKILLEIGVRQGASIRAFKDYLPNTRIIGLDLFEEHPIPDIPGVQFIKGNQIDYRVLEDIRNNINPDAIIDDGSHNSRDQLVTFYSLFHKDCTYFIEDVQCADEEFYRQGLPFEFTAATNGIWNSWLDCQSPLIIVKC